MDGIIMVEPVISTSRPNWVLLKKKKKRKKTNVCSVFQDISGNFTPGNSSPDSTN